MKHEAGTHRVQRVPVTESQGRVHTSSATMMVLPEPEEVEVHIDDNDLRIDTYRASGHGGQSVNTMDSAVRIVHEPTGLVVTMQDEKSQLKNKNKAMRVLRARLGQLEKERADAEASDLRKGQVSMGDRSEKIRTYNFKENRLTDHRIGLTVHKLDRVLAGELDDISDALVAEERNCNSKTMSESTSGTVASADNLMWSELLAKAVARFERAGIETAQIDARGWLRR